MYPATYSRSVHPTAYLLAIKCSSSFRLYVSENHISINILVYEKIQCMLEYVCVLCTYSDFALHVRPHHVIHSYN
jgi:hypothetical protein